jgi:hypothetical protein
MNEVLEELETTGILPAAAEAKPAGGGGGVIASIEPSGPRASFDRVEAAAPAASGVGFAKPLRKAPTVEDVGGVERVLIAQRARGMDATERLDAIQAAALAAQAETARRAVEQREGALRQRERELAEQRRVLAEEYRLLRARSTAPATAAAAGGRRGMAGVQRTAHGAARFDTHEAESWWSRIRRMMLGLERPAVGDN